MKNIIEFRFRYVPFDREFPIRFVDIYIRAETRKEAELIALDNSWKFFNQDCTCQVTEMAHGYTR